MDSLSRLAMRAGEDGCCPLCAGVRSLGALEVTNLMLTTHFLTARLKKLLCAARRKHSTLQKTSSRAFSVSDRSVLRIVAVTHGPHTKVAIRIAALREGWQLMFVH